MTENKWLSLSQLKKPLFSLKLLKDDKQVTVFKEHGCQDQWY